MTSTDELSTDPSDMSLGVRPCGKECMSVQERLFTGLEGGVDFRHILIAGDGASSNSLHFGQVVWAKLASAPFWPAVIFTEENQDWIRHKGKSTYVHVFFFGETAERSWIQTTRVLPFIGATKFTTQRNQWRRKMKTTIQQEQKLTFNDRSNLNVAIRQTEKLAKFSLRKRINVLKNEWWYWDDLMPSGPVIESSIEDTPTTESTPILAQNHDNDTEEILQLFSTNSDELDDIICLSDTGAQSSLRHTTSVCFHPLTTHEEERIIEEMIGSADRSFSACRRVAEKEYLLCIQKNFPSTSIISEHWFYLFVFRHCERLTRLFPQWITDMETSLVQPPFAALTHVPQVKSLVILFKQYAQRNQEQ